MDDPLVDAQCASVFVSLIDKAPAIFADPTRGARRGSVISLMRLWW